MYLYRVFDSFLPLRNPLGFGASDFVIFAIALLLAILLLGQVLLEPYVRRLAPRTVASMAVLFGLTVVLRLALLARHPAPIPTGADDFSYTLLADTLRHFRLANPVHPLHRFFEAVFVLQQPSYASIYPPGQGLAMAAGRLLFNSYWAGVLLSGGIFCAACYWMLRTWVTPNWAFAGGLLAVIEFGPLNPWMNSYWGGYLSGIAGCLVFGSLPRLCGKPRWQYGALLGLGVGLQTLTRPFEALILAVAMLVYVLIWFRADWKSSLKAGIPLAIILGVALAMTALQDKAVTRDWATLPYVVSRYQYGVPTTFTFQPSPIPHRQLTAEQELDYQAQSAIHGEGEDSLVPYMSRLLYRFRYLRFFVLPPLYLGMFVCAPKLREGRYLWVAATVVLFVLGTNVYPYFFPHYLAAIACLFVLLAVAGAQRLNQRSNLYVWTLCFASFAFWFLVCSFKATDNLPINNYQSWNYINSGDPQGRAAVLQVLGAAPGAQLVFVHYSPSHRFEEWIHNDADIDSAKVVWANDLGTEEDKKLLQYYPNRRAWLLEPDTHPVSLTPYPNYSGVFESVH
jgi:hypothetical protein